MLTQQLRLEPLLLPVCFDPPAVAKVVLAEVGTHYGVPLVSVCALVQSTMPIDVGAVVKGCSQIEGYHARTVGYLCSTGHSVTTDLRL